MSEKRRGPQPLDNQSWPFGSATRRLVLEALLSDPQPENGWSKRALERAAETTRGGVDSALRGAFLWGIVELVDGQWRRVEPLPEIAVPIQAILKIVEATPTQALPDLPETPVGRRPTPQAT